MYRVIFSHVTSLGKREKLNQLNEIKAVLITFDWNEAQVGKI